MEKIFGRKMEIFLGEQALGGNGGTGSQTGKGEKDWEEKGGDLGGKRP